MLVKGEETQKAVIRALSDEYSRYILSSTIWKAKSVMELMREYDIPMTSAYRRIKELISCNLIDIEKTVLTEEGKKYDIYRSKISSIDVRFRDGSLEVELTPIRTHADRLMGQFFSLKEEK